MSIFYGKILSEIFMRNIIIKKLCLQVIIKTKQKIFQSQMVEKFGGNVISLSDNLQVNYKNNCPWVSLKGGKSPKAIIYNIFDLLYPNSIRLSQKPCI